MASRSGFGFRHTKLPEKEVTKDKAGGTSLSRKPSVSSSTTKSKDQGSSIFFRSKRSRPETGARRTAQAIIPASGGEYVVDISADRRKEVGKAPETGSVHSVPHESSTGSRTVQTLKSGKSRNVLRRKGPAVERRGAYARTESSSSSYEATMSRQHSDTVYTESEPPSILGLTAPATLPYPGASRTLTGLGFGSEHATSSSHMANYSKRREPQGPFILPSHHPSQTSAQDSGSSVRRSESPGAFSRTSTPTSMSSQSPGVPAPVKISLRTRAASPSRSRPPVTRSKYSGRLLSQEEQSSRNTGLTAVRESNTSSSSSSTVKPESRAGSQRPSNADVPSPRPTTPQSHTVSVKARPVALYPQRQGSLNAGQRSRQQTTTQRSAIGSEVTPESPGVAKNLRLLSPPSRPSREGVPELEVQDVVSSASPIVLQASPQISNNRALRSLEIERSESGRLEMDWKARGGLSRQSSLTSSTQGSRLPSPNPTSSQTSLSRSVRSRPGPSIETSVGSGRSHKDPSPQSATSAKSSGRFGFLRRRSRSPDKTGRKGPIAGTGHEGYGKYAKRGRSGSLNTSNSRGASANSTSIARTPSSQKSSLHSRDEAELDDFYKDRLTPRAIIGGGRGQQDDAGSSDELVSYGSSNSIAPLKTISHTAPILQGRNLRLEPSSRPQEPSHSLRHVNRRLLRRDPAGELTSLADRTVGGPTQTLATRRSLHRSQLLQGAEPLRIPAPIETVGTSTSPLTSVDTYQSSVPASATVRPMSDDISEGHEGNWLKSKAASKPLKSPKRWNFFQRSQASPRIVTGLPASVSDGVMTLPSRHTESSKRVAEIRTVPFYALMDSSEQEITDQASERRMAGSTSQVDYGFGHHVSNSRDISQQRTHNKVSMLLPSPPVGTSEFSRASRGDSDPQLQQEPPIKSDPPTNLLEPRKPRLQQVGRIPRVVSKRDREHRPPPQSFSRPRPSATHKEEVLNSAPTTSDLPSFAISDNPVTVARTDSIPQQPWSYERDPQIADLSPRSSNQPAQSNDTDEFFMFRPRMGSEISGSSSSDILSFAATTAKVPNPDTPLDEDEVWNEYNEFLDTVQSPAASTNSKQDPMDRTNGKIRAVPTPLHIRKDSSVTGVRSASLSKQKPVADDYTAAAPDRALPSPPTKAKRLDFPSIMMALRQSGDYNEHVSKEEDSKHLSKSTTSRYSTSSIESEADSLAGQEARNIQSTSSSSTDSTAVKRLSQIYLRRDALLASRWLSFDRVLFSPAHLTVQSNVKDRVLVLDGLGNDEWSYYCAENYSEAMVYNLSTIVQDERPVASIPGVPAPPHNHKHIHHSCAGRPFPFPQGFFGAAVYRFPKATTETTYFNTVSEFKRVLRPGGYLEISMVDIDMVNMGNLTRRALRNMKERKQFSHSDVSLKPFSDSVQKMLAKKGFENLSRCMLDVPVAGNVNNSRAGSFDEHTKDLPKSQQQEQTNYGIAKNLAKVGRWWYSSCYESGDPARSMWADKALLAECEARETGFKLLLCYAQKPDTKRRTKSV